MEYHIIGHQKCVLCTGTEHFPDGTSEICTVHRNKTLSRRYIRNVYCAQEHNTFQTVLQKYVLCTETEHFPGGTSEMCTVHKKTLSRRYIRNVYYAQKQNIVQTVHQKYVLCTETEHFPGGKSEICTVHSNEQKPIALRFLKSRTGSHVT